MWPSGAKGRPGGRGGAHGLGEVLLPSGHPRPPGKEGRASLGPLQGGPDRSYICVHIYMHIYIYISIYIYIYRYIDIHNL